MNQVAILVAPELPLPLQELRRSLLLLRGSRGSKLLACVQGIQRRSGCPGRPGRCLGAGVSSHSSSPPGPPSQSLAHLRGQTKSCTIRCFVCYPSLPIGVPRFGMVSWGVQPHDMVQAPDPAGALVCSLLNYFCLNVCWRSCSGREGGALLKADAARAFYKKKGKRQRNKYACPLEVRHGFPAEAQVALRCASKSEQTNALCVLGEHFASPWLGFQSPPPPWPRALEAC